MRVVEETVARNPARFWAGWRIVLHGGLAWLRTHWLALTNALQVLILVGAVAAPLLAAAGLENMAASIHELYLVLCLQRPEHSYFLLGHELALEHREIAMFGAQITGGLLYARVRTCPQARLNSLFFFLSSIPLALDIISQMIGMRTSDWITRSWTGAVFSVAFVFWFYPRLEDPTAGSKRRRR